MVSRVWWICNRYESGFGHGLNNDGLDASKTPHAAAELSEAYQIGYEAGQAARARARARKAATQQSAVRASSNDERDRCTEGKGI